MKFGSPERRVDVRGRAVGQRPPWSGPTRADGWAGPLSGWATGTEDCRLALQTPVVDHAPVGAGGVERFIRRSLVEGKFGREVGIMQLVLIGEGCGPKVLHGC